MTLAHADQERNTSSATAAKKPLRTLIFFKTVGGLAPDSFVKNYVKYSPELMETF
jgi:hypothetical protein